MSTNPTALAASPSVDQPAVSGKVAIVKEIKATEAGGIPTYTCVVDGVTIGTSKHKDYFEFHKRRGDIVRLNQLPISKFVYVDEADQIVETKKVDGAPASRTPVTRAIQQAKNPQPAPVGFNNQDHAQAQENGRKGALARLRNLSGGDRPNASAGTTQKPTSGSVAGQATGQSTVRASAKATKVASTSSDKPTASSSDLSPEERRERSREFGRLGAQKAAEKRAQAKASGGWPNNSDRPTASSGPVFPKRRPGRPTNKEREERARAMAEARSN